jgi:uncharacterized protein (TIGR02391 family)
VNAALSFSGLVVDHEGLLTTAAKARTIDDANLRARNLKKTLESRNLHPDVVKFCRAELLNKNYFHAVLEATKSVASKIRGISGLTSDGNQLVGAAFDGNDPLIRINAFGSSSEISEHRGFSNLLKGVVSMFRNPLSHDPKISWELEQQDAEELMGLLSLLHRRLDNAHRRHQ